MQLKREESSGIHFITVEAERLDASCQTQFKDMLRRMTDGLTGRVALDLSQVEFIDSSGLGATVAAMKMLAPIAPLELVALQPPVARLFSLTRLEDVFTIHADRASAIGSAVRAG